MHPSAANNVNIVDLFFLKRYRCLEEACKKAAQIYKNSWQKSTGVHHSKNLSNNARAAQDIPLIWQKPTLTTLLGHYM